MSDSVQRTKVVAASTMPADTLYKHVKTRHPGLLVLYPHVAQLRPAHADEHLWDEMGITPRTSFTHYHEE